MKTMMKKFLFLTAGFLLPLIASAQMQIDTKKVKISDFTEKITKVVLTENPFYASALKREISARWRVSPYEFCTIEEFECLKNSPDYYFLITTKGQFRKEQAPGLQFISLVKGGKRAEKGIDAMLEIVTVPLASADSPSGREFTFLPAFIDLIQAYALNAMDSDISGYAGLSSYAENLSNAKNMKILFSEDDLESEMTEDMKTTCNAANIWIVDESDAEDAMDNAAENTIVSYVVAPADPVPGSYCYKMLFDTSTHELYYYRKHKISKKTSAGFIKEDIKRILTSRK